MNEAVTAVALPRATSRVRPRLQRTRAAAVLAFLLANGVAIVWLWVHGGNLDVHTTGEWLTSFAPTAAFAMGAAAPAWTGSLPRGYEAMTILADGRVLLTPGFPRGG